MNYLPQIRVALLAPKGTGKTTFAHTLQNYYGFSTVSFSSPIRLSLVRAVNAFLADQGINETVSLQDLMDNKESYRLGLQWLGTEIVRDRMNRPTHWINKAMSSIDNITNFHTQEKTLSAIVVDDVRFNNEAEALRDRGFRIVRLVNPTITANDAHQSETQLRSIVTDETIHLGHSKESTEEAAINYGYTLITELFGKLARQGSPVAEGWLDYIRVNPPFEVQQELRQIGGITGIQTAGWATGSRLGSV